MLGYLCDYRAAPGTQDDLKIYDAIVTGQGGFRDLGCGLASAHDTQIDALSIHMRFSQRRKRKAAPDDQSSRHS